MGKPKVRLTGKPAAAKPAAKARATKPPRKLASVAKPKLKRAAPEPPADRLQRLWTAIEEVRQGRHDSPRTARLIASGVPKMAQKVVEEAGEVAIEAVLDRREALINESVDLLYNLAALWNGAGVRPDDLWTEMDRREAAFGMSEKLPKTEEG